MDDSELPKPGDLIGVRYRIEALLGRGGMGAVFSAVNQATEGAVAIKWMLPGAARSRESVARFLAEARATAKIEHPNVIQVLDVGQDRDAPFLVMERLRGESLADRLERGRMGVQEALDVLLPACKGVAEAHSEGIIHRDLKPDNVFCCRGKDGSPRPPKVLDFGISKLFDQGEGATSLTQTGIAMGTPQYMSPEQLNAPPTADARFDVYAMGIVGYECLTGRPPYQAEGLFELVQQIARGNPTPIREMAPETPPDLEAVIMRAMHVHRDHRYATMNEMIAELEGVRARLASGAPPRPMSTSPAGGYGVAPPAGGNAPYAATGPAGFGPAPSSHGGPGGYGVPGSHGPSGGHGGPGGSYGYPPSGPNVHPASGPHVSGPHAPSGGAPARSGVSPLLIGGIGLVLVVGLMGAVASGLGVWFFSRESGSSSGGGGGIASGGGGVVPSGGGGGMVSSGGGGGMVPSGGASDNPREPTINLSFSGPCEPRFANRRMVTGSPGSPGSPGSVSVTAMTGVALTGSLTMMFPNGARTETISTDGRTSGGTLVNLMVGQDIWTNMTMDIMAVRSGRIADPISGTVVVNAFDAELAQADVRFQNVTLQHLRTGSICTINGEVVTRGTTYEL